jgi:hypothetical protein
MSRALHLEIAINVRAMALYATLHILTRAGQSARLEGTLSTSGGLQRLPHTNRLTMRLLLHDYWYALVSRGCRQTPRDAIRQQHLLRCAIQRHSQTGGTMHCRRCQNACHVAGYRVSRRATTVMMKALFQALPQFILQRGSPATREDSDNFCGLWKRVDCGTAPAVQRVPLSTMRNQHNHCSTPQGDLPAETLPSFVEATNSTCCQLDGKMADNTPLLCCRRHRK